jgi:hypothetical protein
LRLFTALLPVLLGACSSIGDFGRLQDPVVTDDIHAWVGQEAAAHAGLPTSSNKLTDDERTLRDLAFPLIEPPYDRVRWDAVLYEYGTKRNFRRDLWLIEVSAYYGHLQGAGIRTTTGRYMRLIDDIRNDIERIGPFFDLARRVVDADQRREEAMRHFKDISDADRGNAEARVGENSLTIAWVYHALTQRCAGYRFALDHLVAAEPERVAGDADVALTQLQQLIAANQVVPEPRVAGLPAKPVYKD